MFAIVLFSLLFSLTTNRSCFSVNGASTNTKIVNVDNFLDNIVPEVEPESSFSDCICVPYWECKEDYSGLEEEEFDIGLLDVRRAKRFVRSNKKTLDPNQKCEGDIDICCKVRCGQVGRHQSIESQNVISESAFSRITGDTSFQAEFAEFPWMLGILRGRVFKCGGSLIHPKVAITAAHCVNAKGLYTVRAGEWNWEKKTEPLPHQDRIVDKVIIHPQFSPGSLRNDIAMLVMESSFKLTRNIGIVCIPAPWTDLDLDRCVATGWGRNSFRKGTYQNVLKKIELPLVDRPTCTKILRNAKLGAQFQLHQSFICAGGQSNRDTCKGDGGSPLMCPLTDQPYRYEQVGIVSWGLTCGLEQTPGVYVNVVIYSRWIDGKMLSLGLNTDIYRSS